MFIECGKGASDSILDYEVIQRMGSTSLVGLQSPCRSVRSSPKISGRALRDISAPPASASVSRGSSSRSGTATRGRRHRGSLARAVLAPWNFSPGEKQQLKEDDLPSV